jgi:hypothetical protein
MRKIKLNAEELTVESFAATVDGPEARGTVQGNDDAITIRISCPATCGGSCDTGQPCVYCRA